jgi:hypothetical protein
VRAVRETQRLDNSKARPTLRPLAWTRGHHKSDSLASCSWAFDHLMQMLRRFTWESDGVVSGACSVGAARLGGPVGVCSGFFARLCLPGTARESHTVTEFEQAKEVVE